MSEQLNQGLLEQSGAAERHSASHAEVRVPKIAFAGAALLMCFGYTITYGTLRVLGDEASLNVTNVFGRGAFFGVVMTIFQLFWERHRARQTEPNHSTHH